MTTSGEFYQDLFNNGGEKLFERNRSIIYESPPPAEDLISDGHCSKCGGLAVVDPYGIHICGDCGFEPRIVFERRKIPIKMTPTERADLEIENRYIETDIQNQPLF